MAPVSHDQPDSGPRAGVLCSCLGDARRDPRLLAGCPRGDATQDARQRHACDLAFLAALLAFLAVLGVGVVRRWRWLFWLLLLAFRRRVGPGARWRYCSCRVGWRLRGQTGTSSCRPSLVWSRSGSRARCSPAIAGPDRGARSELDVMPRMPPATAGWAHISNRSRGFGRTRSAAGFLGGLGHRQRGTRCRARRHP